MNIRVYKEPEERAKIILDEVQELLYDNERLRRRAEHLKEELNAPTDERLAEAYARIEQLERKARKLRENSLILLEDEEQEKLLSWKRGHFDNNPKCLKFAQKFMPFTKGRDNITVMCTECGEEHRIR